MTASAWLRYDVVWPLVSSPRPRRVLEIGPGIAGFGARVARICDTYVGVESSAASREVAAARLAAARGSGASVVATLADVPEGAFDLVCAFEVLEHIEDDRAALADWVGRATAGGRVVLSVPAFSRRFGPGDEAVGHFRRYDPVRLRELAEEVGLRDVETTLYGFPAGYALEAARDLLGRRALRNAPGSGSKAERSASSGRWYQPTARVGRLLEHATAPARVVQRRFPQRGTGLVVIGRLPS